MTFQIFSLSVKQRCLSIIILLFSTCSVQATGEATLIEQWLHLEKQKSALTTFVQATTSALAIQVKIQSTQFAEINHYLLQLSLHINDKSTFNHVNLLLQQKHLIKSEQTYIRSKETEAINLQALLGRA
ncbi:hypothetical protein [Pseudoalteromonas luteoviolacea]|uniref:Uncharacterized protein n=1 Tax=Pseudoalteromonas luteoviolacea H33 TaxID=1365251 RepID=A0A167GVT5_9GAMM|nr:hypothetical protein [Pseudoalteromonas luteoviolacea]KZN56607.1 hypothetical protein N476_00600 [Pseudoalteromonas luteoviolacea H33]KZN75566.1 hypothetical protein N477_17915 [Pseudoalteromonas luteoviolacea H33-S]MBQ4876484.1 hypothetical protein [Pseudoalteromonas luteoviolacea]MBQ4905115.1 hypothetical protein [Pseudoalteromonas luteoviolacea]